MARQKEFARVVLEFTFRSRNTVLHKLDPGSHLLQQGGLHNMSPRVGPMSFSRLYLTLEPFWPERQPFKN